ncbi:MAG: transglycosylase domain-containing protein [Candidatus Melainabacteria bacterium]
MSQTLPDLPIDVRRKSEVVQDRLGLMILTVVIAVITFLLFMVSVLIGSKLAIGASSLPNVALLEKWHPNESTRIFDRRGKLIANIHGDEDRVVVPLSEISPNMQRAVMATEDNRFYHHDGIDVRGTMRALVETYVRHGDVQGGSTITQQLVKNLFLSPERKVTRKLAEAILALRVEKRYSKDRIIEMYLNQVYFGNQSYGIEKAARRYFKKAAKELSISESALLAGLLKAPEGLSPYVYPEAARERQVEVLNKMKFYGYISQQQLEEALLEPMHLNPRVVTAPKYPYFVTFVIQELEKMYGEDMVRRGGLRVYTTLDTAVQEAAENALIPTVKSQPKYSNVTQGAMVVIDVENAEVLAMVGGTDFNKSQFNNATQARRAAGSTFKPFVYLTGFRLGMITPDSPISDRPVSFNTGWGVWRPHNWDGRYMGAMNIRRALTLSRNTTTVQVGMRIGIDEIIKTARLAGVTSQIDRNFSSLLGSSGLSPLEMATAYSTFARGGVRMWPTAIRRLEDGRGREIDLERPEPERVFDAEPVANLVSILVDVVEKGTGRNAILPGRQVAGKTGTTDQVRDVWFNGFTPDMAAVVWMGSEKYVPLHGVFSSVPAKVWGDFAKKFYEIHPRVATTFPVPEKMAVNSSAIVKTTGGEDHNPVEVIPVPSMAEDRPLDRATERPVAASNPAAAKPGKPLVPPDNHNANPAPVVKENKPTLFKPLFTEPSPNAGNGNGAPPLPN